MDEIARRSRAPLTVRCQGTNRDGGPCGRAPIPGGFVCVLHGGKAPQVQKSAKARLLAGADLAIDYLLNLVTPKPPCETCGRSDADRDPVVVRACQLILDRSGFHPTLAVEQAAPPPDEHADETWDETIAHLEALLEQARKMRDAERAGVVDGVVDEGFEVPEETWSSPGVELPITDKAPEIPRENNDD